MHGSWGPNPEGGRARHVAVGMRTLAALHVHIFASCYRPAPAAPAPGEPLVLTQDGFPLTHGSLGGRPPISRASHLCDQVHLAAPDLPTAGESAAGTVLMPQDSQVDLSSTDE